MKLSVIIPSYKDPLLYKTVRDILNKFETDFEIIVVLDGYWYIEPFNDPRVKTVHLGKNSGMREAINAGVKVANGEYIMRTDEHCMFDKGFDRKILAVIEDNHIMTARRYFLDPIKWEVMGLPHVDYERLGVQTIGNGRKFCGLPDYEKTEKLNKLLIDETQAMQGSCWIMKKSWWDKVIGELQTEGYGPLLQDSHEMSFKTWQAGGKLMVNKKTWFAHKHRDFDRTHSHSRTDAEKEVKYCYETWKDFYKEMKKKWSQ